VTTSTLILALETRIELLSLLRLLPTQLGTVLMDGVPTLLVSASLGTVPTEDVVGALELFARRTGREHVQCFPASSGAAITRQPPTPLFA
jgi:hypothetical protein